MHRLLPLSLLALPVVAHAASLKEFTQSLVGIVNTAVMPLLYALAILFFFIGMTRFLFMNGEENRQKGKMFMLWSVIGLVVMFSVWGIVRLFLTLIPGALSV
ncbi:MAG TPA: hypothetical protein VGE48_01950 [Candidatus Paceibacterota bacterium]